MKRRFVVAASIISCLLPLVGVAECVDNDNITLTLGPGSGAGEVTLSWTGGFAPYTITRAASPVALTSVPNVLVQVGTMSWSDLPPAGDIFFYEVTGIGCADGTAEQAFTPFMNGCGGVVVFQNRGALCMPGWYVCSANEWVAKRGAGVPSYNYWTNDILGYLSGGSTGNCAVSLTGPNFCSVSTGPMLVCTQTGPDPNGNTCNFHDCALSPSTLNQYFGGCPNIYAGALCCYP